MSHYPNSGNWGGLCIEPADRDSTSLVTDASWTTIAGGTAHPKSADVGLLYADNWSEHRNWATDVLPQCQTHRRGRVASTWAAAAFAVSTSSADFSLIQNRTDPSEAWYGFSSGTSCRAVDLTESSTLLLARFATPSEISKELSVMVARSQFDDFEFGVESRFERTFSEFLRRYGVVAQDASVRWIAANADKNSPVAVRMVLVLGGEREGVSSEGRYHLLTWLLQSSSAAVRDAAARTLFRVPDPRVREALKTAAEQESNSRVKRFISQLADRITADL